MIYKKQTPSAIALYPNKVKVINFIKKLKEIVKESQNLTAVELITKLNPIIRGWAQYYNMENSSAYRTLVRNAIYQIIWSWMIKKHPTLGKRKLAEMYFLTKAKPLKKEQLYPDSPIPEQEPFSKFKNTKWTFHGESQAESRFKEKSTRTMYLLDPTNSSPILTATKFTLPTILREVHAFHSRVEEFLEWRLNLALKSNPRTPTLKEKLFQSQKGLCGLCHKSIEHEFIHYNTVHIDHINPIKKGGPKANIKNMSLVHSWCHRSHKH
jgi:hypothetical protein